MRARPEAAVGGGPARRKRNALSPAPRAATLPLMPKDPSDYQPGDLTEAAIRATAQHLLGLLLPWGSVFAAMFGRLSPPAFERRVGTALAGAQHAIRELQRRGVDVETLKNDPVFCDFVMDAIAAAMRTHREEKRKALRNAITNAALPSHPGETKARVFLRLIDELDVHHLLLLELMANPTAFLAKRGRPMPGPASDHYVEMDHNTLYMSPRSLTAIVHSELRDELPEDLQEIVLQDLVRRGLTSVQRFGELCLPGRSLASGLGQEFVRFIADPPEPTD